MKSFFWVFGFVLLLGSNAGIELDFGAKKDGTDWQTLNDGVMGGLSKGQIDLSPNALKFFGEVSLDNYGGFTSVKSPFGQYDLSDAKKLTIRYKTEGQRISISLENSDAFYKPYYKLLLPDTKGKWVVTEANISDFKEYNLGQETAIPISDDFLKGVRRIGFITSEKRAGRFVVEIDYLKFE
ncbi:MAG: CIA30 family protein [Bacteroidota bacterium]